MRSFSLCPNNMLPPTPHPSPTWERRKCWFCCVVVTLSVLFFCQLLIADYDLRFLLMHLIHLTVSIVLYSKKQHRQKVLQGQKGSTQRLHRQCICCPRQRTNEYFRVRRRQPSASLQSVLYLVSPHLWTGRLINRFPPLCSCEQLCEQKSWLILLIFWSAVIYANVTKHEIDSVSQSKPLRRRKAFIYFYLKSQNF